MSVGLGMAGMWKVSTEFVVSHCEGGMEGDAIHGGASLELVYLGSLGHPLPHGMMLNRNIE
jgi:hypothetical protein